jgi:ankyrin repeat protein
MSLLDSPRFSVTQYNATPLHYACRYGHGHIVNRLLELHEDPNSLDRVLSSFFWVF